LPLGFFGEAEMMFLRLQPALCGGDMPRKGFLASAVQSAIHWLRMGTSTYVPPIWSLIANYCRKDRGGSIRIGAFHNQKYVEKPLQPTKNLDDAKV
jgi:hypothetical protein